MDVFLIKFGTYTVKFKVCDIDEKIEEFWRRHPDIHTSYKELYALDKERFIGMAIGRLENLMSRGYFAFDKDELEYTYQP